MSTEPTSPAKPTPIYTGVRLNGPLAGAFRAAAARTGRSQQELVQELIRAGLEVTCQLGEPDPTPDGGCEAAVNGFHCTRDPHVTGQHVTGEDGVVVAVWTGNGSDFAAW